LATGNVALPVIFAAHMYGATRNRHSSESDCAADVAGAIATTPNSIVAAAKRCAVICGFVDMGNLAALEEGKLRGNNAATRGAALIIAAGRSFCHSESSGRAG
jgi:hypothetical protein